MKNRGIKGFTLAEVLITLTIIGVIAAITIPNLMKNYQNHITYNALKKNYSILSQVVNQLFREYGDASQWKTSGSGDAFQILSPSAIEIKDFFLSNMKVNCVEPTSNGNFGIYYPREPKCTTGGYGNDSRSVMRNGSAIFSTVDGTIYALWANGHVQYSHEDGIPKDLARRDCKMWIAVDINGKKKPNTIGKDTFVFVITTKGLIPLGYITDNSVPIYGGCNADKAKQDSYKQYTYYACAGRIFKEGGIYY